MAKINPNLPTARTQYVMTKGKNPQIVAISGIWQRFVHFMKGSRTVLQPVHATEHYQNTDKIARIAHHLAGKTDLEAALYARDTKAVQSMLQQGAIIPQKEAINILCAAAYCGDLDLFKQIHEQIKTNTGLNHSDSEPDLATILCSKNSMDRTPLLCAVVGQQNLEPDLRMQGATDPGCSEYILGLLDIEKYTKATGEPPLIDLLLNGQRKRVLSLLTLLPNDYPLSAQGKQKLSVPGLALLLKDHALTEALSTRTFVNLDENTTIANLSKHPKRVENLRSLIRPIRSFENNNDLLELLSNRAARYQILRLSTENIAPALSAFLDTSTILHLIDRQDAAILEALATYSIELPPNAQNQASMLSICHPEYAESANLAVFNLLDRNGRSGLENFLLHPVLSEQGQETARKESQLDYLSDSERSSESSEADQFISRNLTQPQKIQILEKVLAEQTLSAEALGITDSGSTGFLKLFLEGDRSLHTQALLDAVDSHISRLHMLPSDPVEAAKTMSFSQVMAMADDPIWAYDKHGKMVIENVAENPFLTEAQKKKAIEKLAEKMPCAARLKTPEIGIYKNLALPYLDQVTQDLLTNVPVAWIAEPALQNFVRRAIPDELLQLQSIGLMPQNQAMRFAIMKPEHIRRLLDRDDFTPNFEPDKYGKTLLDYIKDTPLLSASEKQEFLLKILEKLPENDPSMRAVLGIPKLRICKPHGFLKWLIDTRNTGFIKEIDPTRHQNFLAYIHSWRYDVHVTDGLSYNSKIPAHITSMQFQHVSYRTSFRNLLLSFVNSGGKTVPLYYKDSAASDFFKVDTKTPLVQQLANQTAETKVQILANASAALIGIPDKPGKKPTGLLAELCRTRDTSAIDDIPDSNPFFLTCLKYFVPQDSPLLLGLLMDPAARKRVVLAYITGDGYTPTKRL